MNDFLTAYEDHQPKKPWIVRIIFILYLLVIAVAIVTDVIIIGKAGIEETLATDRIGFFLSLFDLVQPLLLYGFYRGSKVAWSIIPLVQGMYSAIFLKQYYGMFTDASMSFLDVITSNWISLFFCIACTCITGFSFFPKTTHYFAISNETRIVMMILVAFVMLFNFLYNIYNM